VRAPAVARGVIEEFARRPPSEAAASQVAPAGRGVGHQRGDGEMYLARILEKLALRDRLQAVICVYETALVHAHGPPR
jgi:hypothetical protein